MNVIDLIIQFGTPMEKPGKALEFRLQKRDKIKVVSHLKHLIQSVDKIENKAVLINTNEDEIITVYNCIK